ncbi:MAG: leucyl/phenylalanyl-tRNA--protein transferase [Paraglaciecola sp.]|jgi:leucyl/phenylalanyl-tRNA--protein transferase
MIELYQLDHSLSFPAPSAAMSDPPGLLAFGGDLSVARLKFAYQNGIFPWYSEGEPILWWSPDPRGILPLDNFRVSRSLAKFIRKTPLRVTLNEDFSQVIKACAHAARRDSGTWISAAMISAYQRLHHAGYAQSVEVWDGHKLVGGLYGVTVGALFCGESMFHHSTNASKLAMFYLVQHLHAQGCKFIDCQMQNPHLASLGCIEIPRSEFLAKLHQATGSELDKNLWQSVELTNHT